MAKTITPGGRVGDDAKRGSRSNGENWVERTASGSLPRYIRIVRNGLMKEGKSEGQATALAVAAIKRWAAGGDNVSPKVQAAAAKALAEWEAMKAQKSDGSFDPETKRDAGSISDQDNTRADGDEQKDTGMGLEYKDVGVAGMTVVDAEQGIVETIVSVTGLVDNVKDVILPGAYEKSLATRTPKGVWSHSWDTPVSRTLAVKELMPGDPDLPDTLPSTGQPWPQHAGALKVKTQFNLETQRGRESFSDVVFFGDQQEWSIGYQVPVGGATVDSKTGHRRISHLELYEYSPVLFGAMPNARTQSVKDAQIAFKQVTLPAIEFKSWLEDHGIEFKGVTDEDKPEEDEEQSKPDAEEGDDEGAPDGDKTPEDGDDSFDLSDEDDEQEEKGYAFGVTAYEREYLVATRDAINDILTKADEQFLAFKGDDAEDGEEEAASGELTSIIEENEDALGDLYGDLHDAAQKFDAALGESDVSKANEAGEAALTVVEQNIEDADDDAVTALQAVAAAIADLAPEDMPEDEDDTEKKGADSGDCGPDGMKNGRKRTVPRRSKVPDEPEEKSGVIVMETKELDDFRQRVLGRLR